MDRQKKDSSGTPIGFKALSMLVDGVCWRIDCPFETSDAFFNWELFKDLVDVPPTADTLTIGALNAYGQSDNPSIQQHRHAIADIHRRSMILLLFGDQPEALERLEAYDIFPLLPKTLAQWEARSHAARTYAANAYHGLKAEGLDDETIEFLKNTDEKNDQITALMADALTTPGRSLSGFPDKTPKELFGKLHHALGFPTDAQAESYLDGYQDYARKSNPQSPSSGQGR